MCKQEAIKALEFLYYEAEVCGSEELKLTIIKELKPSSFLEIILNVLDYIECECE